MERSDGRETPLERALSLESDSSSGYDGVPRRVNGSTYSECRTIAILGTSADATANRKAAHRLPSGARLIRAGDCRTSSRLRSSPSHRPEIAHLGEGGTNHV
jgi:hypothetical protein